MEKRDYIESMIEQMGLFLKRLLSVLIKDIGTENSDKTIPTIGELFSNHFNISINELIYLSQSEFSNFIKKHKFKENQLEDLSELLFQLYLEKFKQNNKQIALKEKAILLLYCADSLSNSYSVNRINKKNLILNS